MTRTLLIVIVVLAALSGCTRQATTQAGGKPVAHWVQGVDDPDPHVRKEAVDKLGNVGSADPAARPAVLRGLRDRDPAVRQAAVVAIVKFGRPDAEATGILSDLKDHDPNRRVRDVAARALAGP